MKYFNVSLVYFFNLYLYGLDHVVRNTYWTILNKIYFLFSCKSLIIASQFIIVPFPFLKKGQLYLPADKNPFSMNITRKK